ncbi:hypothetical protein M9H77_07641 [Catharanthus roseus]|uniref:Uncharacterized protein n=1 Tax=Catharanthus roseus TaxID=4058 RepID=A0ACC0BVT1_CATRO|nr:hypothetical protein M9H77_07641 [Catharanthus roseus]
MCPNHDRARRFVHLNQEAVLFSSSESDYIDACVQDTSTDDLGQEEHSFSVCNFLPLLTGIQKEFFISLMHYSSNDFRSCVFVNAHLTVILSKFGGKEHQNVLMSFDLQNSWKQELRFGLLLDLLSKLKSSEYLKFKFEFAKLSLEYENY